MLILMIVSLFTFRELLKLLGIEDYGIYNVVGGVVIVFSFISTAMNQANQRFLSFNLAKNNTDHLQHIFSTIINVQLVVGGIILLLAETVGLWFINKKMNFPIDSITIVNVVYQFSIITFLFHLIQIPYTSAIIAHEKMAFFSYFSIGEAMLKLGVVLSLSLFSSNRLILYSILLTVSAMIIFLTYYIFCKRTFSICCYRFYWNKTIFKEIISFSSWNMLGGIANVGASQGINIILNIFCGVMVNAAMGVSNQVSSAVLSFVSNMQTAFNPQIIKSYAANDPIYFNSLIFRSSRFSFILIFIIGFPIILCCHTVFELWLTDIPQYAIPFTQLIIIFCMIDALSGSLWTAAQASGKVKVYMMIISSLIFSNVPAAYLILWLGFSPIYVILYKVILNLVVHIIRIGYLRSIIGFPALEYLKKVMFPIITYIVITIPIPIILSIHSYSITSNIILMIFTALYCAIIGFSWVLTKSEKNHIISFLKIKLKISKTNPSNS